MKTDLEGKTPAQKYELVSRGVHAQRERVYKRNMKPIEWNGQTFESIRAFAKHIGLSDTSVKDYIRAGRELRGHVPKKVAK